MSVVGDDLLGPKPTLLPEDADALAQIADGADAESVAAQFPALSLAWAILAERELAAGNSVAAYAYARTGYHRGLDALRRNGWRGSGPVPYSHEPNRGFLRAVAALARAAQQIEEQHEYARCLDLLEDCDPRAATELGFE